VFEISLDGVTMMLVFGHRGYHVRAPENTIDAFREAIALGVDGIETDVRLSGDGLPTIFHDRLGPRGEPVATLSRDELSDLVGYPVPTLDAILEEFPEVIWNIEIKTPSVVEAVLPLIERYAPSRRLMITSFWHNIVEEIIRSLSVDGGILVAHRPLNGFHPSDLLGVSGQINTIVWDYEIMDEKMVLPCNEKGIRSLVYGANTREEQERCRALGIFALITDRPDLLLSR
jgi:glycerophosphoryl diester phosphodiesterase